MYVWLDIREFNWFIHHCAGKACPLKYKLIVKSFFSHFYIGQDTRYSSVKLAKASPCQFYFEWACPSSASASCKSSTKVIDLIRLEDCILNWWWFLKPTLSIQKSNLTTCSIIKLKKIKEFQNYFSYKSSTWELEYTVKYKASYWSGNSFHILLDPFTKLIYTYRTHFVWRNKKTKGISKSFLVTLSFISLIARYYGNIRDLQCHPGSSGPPPW